MSQAEHNAKLRVFLDLPLVEQIILYERGEIFDPRGIVSMFQEMINTGVCWNEEMPKHYACYAANYIRQAQCAESSTVAMPEEAREDYYLFENMWIGYDMWNRPPTHEDWGRPLRWQEIRAEKIRAFKINMTKKKNGQHVEMPKGCCK
jgi:hypothetical protein